MRLNCKVDKFYFYDLIKLKLGNSISYTNYLMSIKFKKNAFNSSSALSR